MTQKAAPVIPADKAKLRLTLREKRKDLQKTGQHASFSAAACAHFRHMINETPGLTVAAYWPLGSELDVRPLLDMTSSARYCLPTIAADTRVLSFRLFEDLNALIDGPHGTKQPAAEAAQVMPDILCVPLLGFDSQGGRLGQGGGYYDATIAALRLDRPDLKVFGIGFTCQEIPHIPTEPHDAALDAIATEIGFRYV